MTTREGVATIILYDDWKPIAEWDGWTEDYFQAWNVYGPGADEILLRHEAKMGYVRYHSDANGNMTFLLDNDGTVVEKYTYDVFGRPKIMGPGGEERTFSHWNNRFLFQGREYIGELGVYDYRHRFYDPELGRFLQVDPTGFDAGDMNLFRYCSDDPIDLSDPMGLEGKQFDNLNDAISAARGQVVKAAFGRQKAQSDPVLKRPIVHSAMVPVLSSGRGYELGPLVRGVVEKRYNDEGQSYGVEKEGLTPQQIKRLVIAVHSHNNKHGVASPKWSTFDEDLPRQGKMVEKANESNPGRWLRLVPAKNARGYQELDTTDINNPRPTDGNTSSDSGSSGSTKKELRGVEFPDLGAEATNRASGPR